MTNQKNVCPKGEKSNALKKGLLSYILLVLSLVTFSYNAFSEVIPPADFTVTNSSDELITVPYLTFNSYYNSPCLPDLPDPIPAEPDDSDEQEKENDLEDVGNFSFNAYNSEITCCKIIKTEYLSQSLQHRKTIPLFILFHT